MISALRFQAKPSVAFQAVQIKPSVHFSGSTQTGDTVNLQNNAESNPVAFIKALPNEMTARQRKALFKYAVKHPDINTDYFEHTVEEREALAQKRLPEHALEKGYVGEFLKIKLQNIENTSTEKRKQQWWPLYRDYIELATECRWQSQEQLWAQKASEEDIQNKDARNKMGGIEASSYPARVKFQTAAYYKGLAKSPIDFAKLGDDLLQLGLGELKKEEPQSAADIDPNYPDGYFTTAAAIYQQFGQPDKALGILKRGLAILTEREHEDHALSHRLGIAQMAVRLEITKVAESLGDWSEVLKQQEARLQLFEAGKTAWLESLVERLYIDLAIPYFELGQYDKALEYAQKAHDIKPDGRVYSQNPEKHGRTHTDLLGRILIAMQAKK